nr:hypothetical protein [Rhodococcus sp. HNM0569]
MALGTPTTVAAAPAERQQAADDQPQMLLVHGYNGGSDAPCDDIWGKALDYYEEDGKRPEGSMTTIGYYKGDTGCDEKVGENTTDTPIQDVARDFAHYIYDNYTKDGKSVDIVAHSMGGLVTRVAMLGSYEEWEGFPPALKVQDVATLGTPHQGIANGCAEVGEDCTTQWNQMTPSAAGGSGFIDKLHESEDGAADRGLDDAWAADTDWSLIGSNVKDSDGDGKRDGDGTVFYNSAIDKGYHADQKYGYRPDVHPEEGENTCGNDPEIDHHAIRELTGAGGFCLRYWHASGDDQGPFDTFDGWSPLKAAFKAVTHIGDDLPR